MFEPQPEFKQVSAARGYRQCLANGPRWRKYCRRIANKLSMPSDLVTKDRELNASIQTHHVDRRFTLPTAIKKYSLPAGSITAHLIIFRAPRTRGNILFSPCADSTVLFCRSTCLSRASVLKSQSELVSGWVLELRAVIIVALISDFDGPEVQLFSFCQHSISLSIFSFAVLRALHMLHSICHPAICSASLLLCCLSGLHLPSIVGCTLESDRLGCT